MSVDHEPLARQRKKCWLLVSVPFLLRARQRKQRSQITRVLTLKDRFPLRVQTVALWMRECVEMGAGPIGIFRWPPHISNRATRSWQQQMWTNVFSVGTHAEKTGVL